jgi:hypothetical protein
MLVAQKGIRRWKPEQLIEFVLCIRTAFSGWFLSQSIRNNPSDPETHAIISVNIQVMGI